MDKLQTFNAKHTEDNKFKGLKPGWTVKVYQKIKEGNKTRTQAFEGVVIARKHGEGPSGSITLRRVHGGFGVEKIYPLYLPSIEKVAVVKETKAKRAKLYYLRDKSSKEIRRKIKTRKQKPKQEVESLAPVDFQ